MALLETLDQRLGLLAHELDPIGMGSRDIILFAPILGKVVELALRQPQLEPTLHKRNAFAADEWNRFIALIGFAGKNRPAILSVDAMKGSMVPFDPRIHAVRRQQGQIDTAGKYVELIEGSEINQSHLNCDKVQDPYSLRCQPQVMGAALGMIRHAAETLLTEANAVTDNPLIFPEEGDILSGGNFHAKHVAMAADMLAIAVAEVGSMSERRTALLVDPNMSGLPAFLVADGGLNSGFMIAQVTSALVSANKSMAHPACVDSIPTSAGQEDHVSMATFAARRLSEMAFNAGGVIAIELLSAAQGIDFHRPARSSDALEQAHAFVRENAAVLEKDRYFAPDIEAVRLGVASGQFNGLVGELLPSFEIERVG